MMKKWTRIGKVLKKKPTKNFNKSRSLLGLVRKKPVRGIGKFWKKKRVSPLKSLRKNGKVLWKGSKKGTGIIQKGLRKNGKVLWKGLKKNKRFGVRLAEMCVLCAEFVQRAGVAGGRDGTGDGTGS